MDQNYTVAFTVDQTPQEVFAAINNVRGWWIGDVEGITDQVGEAFSYRYQDIHYSKQQIAALTPGKKVVWDVVDSHLSFTQDKAEWKGTQIVFEIAAKGDKTEVRFTHIGLVPAYECFESCSNAWGFYINSSLRNFIRTGEAQTTTA